MGEDILLSLRERSLRLSLYGPHCIPLSQRGNLHNITGEHLLRIPNREILLPVSSYACSSYYSMRLVYHRENEIYKYNLFWGIFLSVVDRFVGVSCHPDADLVQKP